MGENVLAGQVKSFKKGADRSLARMSGPTLFDRPEIISTTYTAAPLDGATVSVGDIVDAYSTADGTSVLIAKGHRAVAEIGGDGATSLVAALRERGGPGILPMSVSSISAVSGSIKLVVARSDASNGS